LRKERSKRGGDRGKERDRRQNRKEIVKEKAPNSGGAFIFGGLLALRL
jgi:hypothetical protein